MSNKQRGGFFSLVPVLVLFVAFMVIISIDLTLIFFANKEARVFSERVAEASVSLLLRENRQDSGSQFAALSSLISQTVTELFNSTNFKFITLDPEVLEEHGHTLVSVHTTIPNSASSLIEITLGEVINLNSQCTSGGGFLCNKPEGCWCPAVLSGSIPNNSLRYLTSVRVRFNANRVATPYTFLLRLLSNLRDAVYAKTYSSLKPRIVFVGLDTSWSTVEGETQFSRVGRFASLPHYELTSQPVQNNGVYCMPELNRALVEGVERGVTCEFKRRADLIWNSWRYMQPFKPATHPTRLSEGAFDGYFEMKDNTIWFYREGNLESQDFLTKNDYFVLNYFDKSLKDKSNTNLVIFHNLFQDLVDIDEINKGLNPITGAPIGFWSQAPYDSQNIQLRTPRLYDAPNLVARWEFITRALIHTARFPHPDFVVDMMASDSSLRSMLMSPSFLWNAQYPLAYRWLSGTNSRTFSSLGIEVSKSNSNTIVKNLLWPHFFMGSVRPTSCRGVNGSNLCFYDHFRPAFSIQNGSTVSNNQQLNSLPEWIVNSHDGGIYKRYQNMVIPDAFVHCCYLISSSSNQSKIFCHDPLEIDVTTSRVEGGVIVGRSDDIIRVRICEGSQSVGGVFEWPSGLPLLESEYNYGDFNYLVNHRPDTDVHFQVWRIPIGHVNLTNNTAFYYTENANIDQNNQPLIDQVNLSMAPRICGRRIDIQHGNSTETWFTDCRRFEQNVLYRFPSVSTEVRTWTQPEGNRSFRFLFIQRAISRFNPDYWAEMVRRYLVPEGSSVNDGNIKILNPGRLYNPSQDITSYLQSRGCTWSTTNPNQSKACWMVGPAYFPLVAFNLNQSGNFSINSSATSYMSKSLNLTRYMSDYFPVTGIRIVRSTPTLSTQGQLTLSPSTVKHFDMLVENPTFLREREFFTRSSLPQDNTRSRTTNPCEFSVCETVNSHFSSPTACPYQLGRHPQILHSLCYSDPVNNDNRLPYLLCCNWLRDGQSSERRNVENTMFTEDWTQTKLAYPDFIWRNYVGPQPLSDILQGVALTHELLRTDFRVHGDKFGILPYADSIGSTKVTILPVDIINKNGTSLQSYSDDELAFMTPLPNNMNIYSKRLETFLRATLPQVGNDPFHVQSRIRERYRLGLFPSIGDTSETNTIMALATAALLLRQYTFTNQVLLPFFTDLISFGSCNYTVPSDGKLTWAQIEECVRRPKNRDIYGSKETIIARYDQYLNELLFDLTGDSRFSTNLPPDAGTKVGKRHQGFLKFLSENGITPIIFVFNGTAGGIPIMPNPDWGSSNQEPCIFTREELKRYNLPTAFRSGHDSSFRNYPGASIYLATQAGGFGNIYAYRLGELEPYILSAGGEFAQLLPKCPQAPNGQSVKQRIFNFFNYSVHKLGGNIAPVPTHFSMGNTFGLCGHIFGFWRQNYPHAGWYFINHNFNINLLPSCLAFDFRFTNGSSPPRGNERMGVNLMNFGVDFKMPPEIRPDLNQSNPSNELYNLHEFLFFSRRQNFILTWMPHIQISIAGGLRCHPDLDLKTQIRNVLADILRRPQISIVTNYHEITGTQSVPSSAEDSPVSAE